MKTPEGIHIIPTTHQEVVALLTSDELDAVESPIAERCRFNILHDLSSTTTSSVQAEVSVSGMSVSEIVDYMVNHRKHLIEFGVRFLGDDDATNDEQEYPEGEEQVPDGESVSLGYGVGFGVKYAIYHNFLSNRPAGALRAFLKNRRIPRHTKFANELARVFTDTQEAPTEEA